MSYSFRTNESKKLNLYDFVMPYLIITFRRVIFSDTSTSSFKSELMIRSLWHALVAIWMLFLKVLMRKVLTRYKIVLWYRFRRKWEWRINEVRLFCFAPSWIYGNKFCKAFKQKALHQTNLFCDFSDLKHVRTIATCKMKTFLSRKFLKTIFCYFWKIRSQSNNFYHPFRTFAIKVKSI